MKDRTKELFYSFSFEKPIPNLYFCPYCKIRLAVAALSRHLKKTRVENKATGEITIVPCPVKPPTGVECDICGKELSNVRNALDDHKRAVHSFIVSCSECGAGFWKEVRLNAYSDKEKTRTCFPRIVSVFELVC